MDRRLWPHRNHEPGSFGITGVMIMATMVALTVDATTNNNLHYHHHYHNSHHGLVQHQTSGMRAAKITEKFHIQNGGNHHHHHHHHIIAAGARNQPMMMSAATKNSLETSPMPPMPSRPSPVDEQLEGLIILNRLVKESFLLPTFSNEPKRNGRRRIFADIPMLVRKVFRGLTNLTVAISRTIHSENGNGSLSRLITHRLIGVSESLMGWVERSVDDLPSIPRLDAQECMKRVICEAHNQPKKYGAVGLVIQLFFPPYLDAEDANKIVSKYQLAARYGRGENANCGAQYDDCMVNVLDLLQGAINMLF